MTFEQWFETRTRHADEDGRSLYVYLTGDEDGAAVAVIEFEAGYLLETADGHYEAIVERDEISTRDLQEAARFVWDNHARHEIAAKEQRR